MIDYSEIERYFKGTITRVIENAGGIGLTLGDDIRTLLYKVDDDHYVDVNNPNRIAQVYGDKAIREHYILQESSLVPVKNKMDMVLHSGHAKRLAFNPRKYNNREQKMI